MLFIIIFVFTLVAGVIYAIVETGRMERLEQEDPEAYAREKEKNEHYIIHTYTHEHGNRKTTYVNKRKL